MDVENGKTVYQKLHIKPKEKEQPTKMIHIIDVIKHWKTSLGLGVPSESQKNRTQFF